MSFPDAFNAWLDRAVVDGVPQSVEAFSFNLFEPARARDAKFGVELIGAGEFSSTNVDWACEEVWEPTDRRLNIPLSFSGETWEECLLAIQSLVQTALAADTTTARILKSRQGVGIGFVDGDLSVVWP